MSTDPVASSPANGTDDAPGAVPPASSQDLRGATRRDGRDEPEEADVQRAIVSALPAHVPGSPVTDRGARRVCDWISRQAPYRRRAEGALAGTLERPRESNPAGSVRKLLSSLALWVLDLPASESHHHSYRLGLLDHLLEVALAATLPFAFRRKIAPVLDRRDPGVLLLLAVTGLLHDVGKVFSVAVRAPGSGELWNPLREPLVYFKVRQGMRIFEPTPFRFIQGRGLRGHEEKGTALVPLVLPRTLREEAGDDIAAAYDAYTGRYDPTPIRRRVPMDYVASCVQHADSLSARTAWARKEKPGALLRELKDEAASPTGWRGRPEDSSKDPDREATCGSAGMEEGP